MDAMNTVASTITISFKTNFIIVVRFNSWTLIIRKLTKPAKPPQTNQLKIIPPVGMS